MGAKAALVLAIIAAAGIAFLPEQWKTFALFSAGLVAPFLVVLLAKYLARRGRRG